MTTSNINHIYLQFLKYTKHQFKKDFQKLVVDICLSRGFFSVLTELVNFIYHRATLQLNL